MKIQTVRNVSAVENAKMSVQPALSIQEYVPKPEFNGHSAADSAVRLQVVKGRYKRPLTSRDLIGL